MTMVTLYVKGLSTATSSATFPVTGESALTRVFARGVGGGVASCPAVSIWLKAIAEDNGKVDCVCTEDWNPLSRRAFIVLLALDGCTNVPQDLASSVDNGVRWI